MPKLLGLLPKHLKGQVTPVGHAALAARAPRLAAGPWCHHVLAPSPHGASNKSFSCCWGQWQGRAQNPRGGAAREEQTRGSWPQSALRRRTLNEWHVHCVWMDSSIQSMPRARAHDGKLDRSWLCVATRAGPRTPSPLPEASRMARLGYQFLQSDTGKRGEALGLPASASRLRGQRSLTRTESIISVTISPWNKVTGCALF
jgi:hypothetical protein